MKKLTPLFVLTLVGFLSIADIAPADTIFNDVCDGDGVPLYQTFADLVTWAEQFETDNSDIVKVVKYGCSHEKRSLLAIQLSLTPGVNNASKPEFLFTGGVHAREVIGSEACYQLAEYIVKAYRGGEDVDADLHNAALDIFAEREVWILPNMNPDGRIRVEEGDSQHRKNTQYFSGQTASNYTCGIDLNRNFPHEWSRATSYVRSEQYRGPTEALSAVEANAFWFDLLKNTAYFSNIMAAIDFHSGVETILTPWVSEATSTTSSVPTADQAKFDQLAQAMQEITKLSINDLSYDAYGTLTDSLYEEFGTYALCEELHYGAWEYPYDYFDRFNPLTQAGIDNAVAMAIDSSMFLLSDAAFNMAPEPAVSAMLLLVIAAAFYWKRLSFFRHKNT